MKIRSKPFEGVAYTQDEILAGDTDVKWQGEGRVSGVWDIEQGQWIKVNDGDLILVGPKGEHYPCSADVFSRKYEVIS